MIDRLTTVDTHSLDLTVDIPCTPIHFLLITLSYIHCLSTLVCVDNTVHLCVQYLTFGSYCKDGFIAWFYLLLNESYVSRPLPAPAFAASMISQKLELHEEDLGTRLLHDEAHWHDH